MNSNISLEPDPFREVLADRTLQEVVDKIFPWMRKKEEEEERDFYAARGIKLKPEYDTAEASAAKKQKTDDGDSKQSAKDVAMSKVEFDFISFVSSQLHNVSNPNRIITSLQKSISDMLDLQVEPYEATNCETSLPPLRCPMLRTSGRLKIVSIKKYLIQRLGLNDTQSSVCEIKSLILFEITEQSLTLHVYGCFLLHARLKFSVMVIQ
jgi:hypothetical protein